MVVAKFNETGEDVVCNNWDLSARRKEGISLRDPPGLARDPEINRFSPAFTNPLFFSPLLAQRFAKRNETAAGMKVISPLIQTLRLEIEYPISNAVEIYDFDNDRGDRFTISR